LGQSHSTLAQHGPGPPLILGKLGHWEKAQHGAVDLKKGDGRLTLGMLLPTKRRVKCARGHKTGNT
jgi:hypothetical protein